MEGLRRAVKIVTVDVIGFGEDFAFKNGPLLSPAMFRQFLQPRYAKAMAFAREHGCDLTWHDGDGDCRLLLPEFPPISRGTITAAIWICSSRRWPEVPKNR
jgi:predicted TIM-barrel fold metal-dependent hydrolase